MAKYIFFGLPLWSVHKALVAVMSELSIRGNDVVYYNTAEFTARVSGIFRSKDYPTYTDGYDTARISHSTSFFSFAEMLLDTTISLFDYLEIEVALEEPQIIAHSHLAMWGKFIAMHAQIPAVALYTTFSLNQHIMVPFFRSQRIASKTYNNTGIEAILKIQKKYQSFYKKAGFTFQPDIWDAYINKERCNIFLIAKELAIAQETSVENNYYVGYPNSVPDVNHVKLHIYVSMGTIFNEDAELFKLIIGVLAHMGIPSIISIGSKIDPIEMRPVPNNISLVEFADQEAALAKAKIFVTRGGMASIHEAIASVTPMIVIPEIPEQQLSAGRIEELGIGIQLPVNQLTNHTLTYALEHLMNNIGFYIDNLQQIVRKQPVIAPAVRASDIMENYCECPFTAYPDSDK